MHSRPSSAHCITTNDTSIDAGRRACDKQKSQGQGCIWDVHTLRFLTLKQIQVSLHKIRSVITPISDPLYLMICTGCHELMRSVLVQNWPCIHPLMKTQTTLSVHRFTTMGPWRHSSAPYGSLISAEICSISTAKTCKGHGSSGRLALNTSGTSTIHYPYPKFVCRSLSCIR